MKILLFVLFFTQIIFSQIKIEKDIDSAYQNAKKGIYWALSNIPEKKSKLDDDLVADDKLYSSVKLEKEINGIKIESTGYFNTNEVKITIFKSNDSLKKNGYLKEEEKKSESN